MFSSTSGDEATEDDKGLSWEVAMAVPSEEQKVVGEKAKEGGGIQLTLKA